MLHLISKKKKRKNATDTYSNRSRKYNCSEKKRKKTGHKMMIKRGKMEKTAETKKQNANPRGGVTRPPSQFESYSLSASSKSYSGRSYSAPKPD